VYIVPLSTENKSLKAPKQLTSGKQGATHTPVLSPSGVWAAWLELAEDGYESDRARIVLLHVESDSRKVLESLDKWDRSPSGIIWNREGNALWLDVADDGYVRVYKLDLPGDDDLEAFVSGKQSKWAPTPVAYTQTGAASGLAALPDNKLLYSLSSLSSPNELHLLTGKGESKQLTNFMSSYLDGKSNVKLGAGESYWFEGDKGIKVQGWVLKPKGYDGSKSSKKWPAVM
jgi:dipeptidyl aminopeptidase/acylaminoacyl peptidase